MKEVKRSECSPIALDGLKQLIIKRLADPDGWRGSTVWASTSPSTMYKASRTEDGGYELLIGVKWSRLRDEAGAPTGRWNALVAARILTDADFLPKCLDITRPAVSLMFPSIDNVIHYVWNRYVSMVNNGKKNERARLYRRRTPKYVFIDPEHPATLMAHKKYGKHFACLRVREYDGSKWNLLAEEIISPGNWVRTTTGGSLTQLSPINLRAARCDFKMARRNARVLRGVEDTVMTLSKVTGVGAEEVVREYSNMSCKDHVVTLKELNQRIADKEDSLTPEEVSTFMSAAWVATAKEAERFGIDDQCMRLSRYRRPKVPRVDRPTPVDFDGVSVTTINCLEDLNGFAHRS